MEDKIIAKPDGSKLIPINKFSTLNIDANDMSFLYTNDTHPQINIPNAKESPLYKEVKQLNDKIASQTLYIKQLKTDLEEEREDNKVLSKKLSSKDWKISLLSFIAGFGATVIGGIILGII